MGDTQNLELLIKIAGTIDPRLGAAVNAAIQSVTGLSSATQVLANANRQLNIAGKENISLLQQQTRAQQASTAANIAAQQAQVARARADLAAERATRLTTAGASLETQARAQLTAEAARVSAEAANNRARVAQQNAVVAAVRAQDSMTQAAIRSLGNFIQQTGRATQQSGALAAQTTGVNNFFQSLARGSQLAGQALQQLNQYNSQGQGFLTTLLGSGTANSFKGNILADMVQGFVGSIGGFFEGAKQQAIDFLAYVVDITNEVDIASKQIDVLFKNISGSQAQAAAPADAIEFAKRTTVFAPFVDFRESITAIRQLSAAGLDYSRWLEIVQNTAAGTAFSIEDMEGKIKSVTYALSNIAAGSVGMGIRSLRQLGINVREAGIEFDKSGSAIGSSEEILAKLETYLSRRFLGTLGEVNKTLPALVQNFQDLRGQLAQEFFSSAFAPVLDRAASAFDDLILKTDDLGNNGATRLRAFFSVLGDYAGSGLNDLLILVDQGFGQLTGPDLQSRLAEGGARLILAFADGMLQGISFVIRAAAQVASVVASFLVGMSPPEQGPLSTIDKGGANIIDAWGKGMEAQAGKLVQTVDGIAAKVAGSLNRFGPNFFDVFGGGSTGGLLQAAMPNSEGLLSGIKILGSNAAASYLQGFRAGFDLSSIQTLVGNVEQILRYAVDTKQIAESAYAPYLDTLTSLLYRAGLEIQEFGSTTEATLNQIGASFGQFASNIQNILGLVAAISNVSAAILSAQSGIESIQAGIEAYNDQIDVIEKDIKTRERVLKQVLEEFDAQIKSAEGVVKAEEVKAEAAQKIIDEIEKRIESVRLSQRQFDVQTSGIPERFLRGRRREFDITLLRLDQEKNLAELQKDAADARIKAANAEVDRIKELRKLAEEAARREIDALRERIAGIRELIEGEQDRLKAAQKHLAELNKQKSALSDLLKLEQDRLQAIIKAAQEQAKLDKAAAGAGDIRGFVDPNIGQAVNGLSDKFKKLKEQTDAWLKSVAGPEIERIKKSYNELKTLIGSFFEPLVEQGEGGEVWENMSPGAVFRRSLIEIRDNFYKIGDGVQSFIKALGELKKAWDDQPQIVKDLIKAAVAGQVFGATGAIAIALSVVGLDEIPPWVKDLMSIALAGKVFGLAGAITAALNIVGYENVPDWVKTLIPYVLGIASGLSILNLVIPISFSGVAGGALTALSTLLGFPVVVVGATLTAALLLKIALDAKIDPKQGALLQRVMGGDTSAIPEFALRFTASMEPGGASILHAIERLPDDIRKGQEAWAWLTTQISALWETARLNINIVLVWLQAQSVVVYLAITAFVRERIADMQTAWAWLGDKVGGVWTWILTFIIITVLRIVAFVGEKIEEIKRGWKTVETVVSTVWNAIWATISETMVKAAWWIAQKILEINLAWESLKLAAVTAINALGSLIDINIVQPLSRAYKAITDAIDKFKELLKLAGIEIKLPSLPAPTGTTGAPPVGNNDNSPPPTNSGGDVDGMFQAGGIVNRMGKYLLHAGEVVLNQRQQTNVLRQMVGGVLAGAGPSVQITHVWEVVPDLEDRLDLESRMTRVSIDTFNTVLKQQGRR